MPNDNNKKSGDRIPRMNAIIKQELGSILPEFLENTPGLTTVTKVEVSRDLKWAKVWISILGGDDDEILAVLKKDIYAIQGHINRILPTKVLPRLQFFLDTSSRYAARINEVLDEIHREE